VEQSLFIVRTGKIRRALRLKNAEFINADRLRSHAAAAAVWTAVTIAGEVSPVTGSHSYMKWK
jgi:hypothetical protein